MKGVQDALRRLDGVAETRVDLQTNLVTITPVPDVELALESIPAAIRRAGFTPEDLRIEARGTFLEREGRRVFRITGWRAEFPVRGESAAGGGEVEIRARVEPGNELVLLP